MVTHEIYVAFDNANLDPEQASQAHWETEMSSHKAKYKFIKQSVQQQQFFAFRVSVNAASRPDTVLLQDELNYVSQYAIHKAKELEELMWNIEGELYITDITDEVLVRYQLA